MYYDKLRALRDATVQIDSPPSPGRSTQVPSTSSLVSAISRDLSTSTHASTTPYLYEKTVHMHLKHAPRPTLWLQQQHA